MSAEPGPEDVEQAAEAAWLASWDGDCAPWVKVSEPVQVKWRRIALAVLTVNQVPERLEIARIEGRAEALNAAWQEIDNDADAQLLARRAVQWEAEAAAMRREIGEPAL